MPAGIRGRPEPSLYGVPLFVVAWFAHQLQVVPQAAAHPADGDYMVDRQLRHVKDLPTPGAFVQVGAVFSGYQRPPLFSAVGIGLGAYLPAVRPPSLPASGTAPGQSDHHRQGANSPVVSALSSRVPAGRKSSRAAGTLNGDGAPPAACIHGLCASGHCCRGPVCSVGQRDPDGEPDCSTRS